MTLRKEIASIASIYVILLIAMSFLQHTISPYSIQKELVSIIHYIISDVTLCVSVLAIRT